MGTIKVTVQTEKRLNAINNLSEAIKHVAIALASGPVVEITGNTIKGVATGIHIDTQEEIFETTIEKT